MHVSVFVYHLWLRSTLTEPKLTTDIFPQVAQSVDDLATQDLRLPIQESSAVASEFAPNPSTLPTCSLDKLGHFDKHGADARLDLD